MASTPRPNVLLVTVDQWSGRWLGAAGHPAIRTPTLDKLAGNGVRYSRAYSAHPICIPARRTLMTGTTGRTHGDRTFSEHLTMPELPTIAQTFSNAGYQTFAVGKLHVYPQRDRIGFDDVVLFEEGRHQFGMAADDWELHLAAQGYAGRGYAHAMGNNDYQSRPWHLPEELHPTNWLTEQMCRTIQRRDPTRPAFWYLSYNFPHPPLVPLDTYRRFYDDVPVPPPVHGRWADDLPYALAHRRNAWSGYGARESDDARRAFFAQCTQIDHQLRLVIGTLREEGLLNDTVIAFTADHGDMLGNHGLWAKGVFYEDSAHVPLIIVPTADYRLGGHHLVDDRLAELRDVMPTLLQSAGVDIPSTVEGQSLVSDQRRRRLYGEFAAGDIASRMIMDNRHKLIYYPCGNRTQLFDLVDDPDELADVSTDPAHRPALTDLTAALIDELYGDDLAWLDGAGQLIGLPAQTHQAQPDRGLSGQRGWHVV